MEGFGFVFAIGIWIYGTALWFKAMDNMQVEASKLWMFTPCWLFMSSLFDNEGEVARVKSLLLAIFCWICLFFYWIITQ